MSTALLAKKLGMTRFYNAEGVVASATVLLAGPCTVLQKKTPEKHGYSAIQISFDLQKKQRIAKPLLGELEKAGVVKENLAPARFIREVRDFPRDVNVGDALTVKEFQAGQYVDVIGVTKGQGFQGVVTRWKHRGGPNTHGAKGWHRRVGAIGQRSFPGNVRRGLKMPGHMGHVRRTVQNLRILQIREADNVLIVSGAVPGPTGGYLMVQMALKGQKVRKQVVTLTKKVAPKAAAAAKAAAAKPAAAAKK